MSRRASVFARLNPGRRRVRFPDEVVFEDHIKESDGDAIMNMLRRASVDIDVDRINMSGMTALHQAVLDDNLVMVRLLIQHGAKINKRDEDHWTPLHAAAANGLHHIAKYLLSQGADKEALTDEGETSVDLVDPEDYKTMAVLLNTKEAEEKDRRLSVATGSRREPAWFRRESIQRESVLETGKAREAVKLSAASTKTARDGTKFATTSSTIKPKFSSDERKFGVRMDTRQSDKDSFSALRARKGSMWVAKESTEPVKEEEEEVEEMDVSSDNQKGDIETEETVTLKLEQWKKRRIERLER